MRQVFALFIGGLLFPASSVAAAPAAPSSFNVLMIIADDLNCDLGCYGHKVVRTPNLDRLASSSVRFDRAYVQYPVCNPSRSSFLTGLDPEALQVFNNQQYFRRNRPDVVTLPQLFRKSGFFTAAFGKVFHRGSFQDRVMEDRPSWDLDSPGSAKAAGNKGEGRNLASGKPIFSRWLAAEGTDEDQIDGQIAKEAIEFLEDPRGEPFFMIVGFNRPHVPLQCPRKYFDLYPIEDLVLPVVSTESIPEPALPEGDYREAFESWTDQERREFMRGYYACVSFMDAQVGKVLDALERLDLDEKTLVVFLGDQGYHLGEQGWWNKNTLFESSLRAPLLIRVPGMNGNGRACRGLVEFLDLYPTIADLCGLMPPAGLPGESLRPLLSDPSRPGRSAARSMIRRGKEIVGRSIRTDRWRYTEWNEGKRGVELYDFAEGQEEEIDRSKDPKYAEVRAELAALLRQPVANGGKTASAGESLVRVSQPTFVHQAGDSIRGRGSDRPDELDAVSVIREVEYLLSADLAKSPETEVRLTVAQRADSMRHREPSSDRDSFLRENRNAAFLSQLRLTFPEGSRDSSGARFPGLFGDTLVVVLDLSNAMESKSVQARADRFNEIVEQTVQCLFLNAKRRWPRIKHLALSIDGSHAHEHWENVYSLEENAARAPASHGAHE
jgi:uncharacterized sulfatase